MNTEEYDPTKKFIQITGCIILLLILLAMSSCSIGKTSTGNGNGYSVTTENGYIVNDSQTILVTRQLEASGQRTMTKRAWGLDGVHFTEDEEYLESRSDLVAALKNGQTIQYTIQ